MEERIILKYKKGTRNVVIREKEERYFLKNQKARKIIKRKRKKETF